MISQTVLNILDAHTQKYGMLSESIERITSNYKQK